MSTFEERITQLSEEIGFGTLTAVVEFDQVYAHRQHEELGWKHLHGGGPKFLERALYDNIPEYMELLASQALDTRLRTAMIGVVEDLAAHATTNAPKRAGYLEHSDRATVFDGETPVYDRPASRPRLTEEEIEGLNKGLQDPHHYYGHWPAIPRQSNA